jgi:hypothetical protein
MYATDRSGTCVSTTIDNNVQVYANSIAVDNDLHVHISSYNNSNGTQTYATDRSGM